MLLLLQLTSDSAAYTIYQGEYTIAKRKGDEQAYIGADGVCDYIQVGSMNPAMLELSFGDIYWTADIVNLCNAFYEHF